MINFKRLDEKTRKFMLDEVEGDIKNGVLYISDRLNAKGKIMYPNLLKQAITNGDEVVLANNLNNLFNETYQRRNQKGGISEVRMPINAASCLADGELSRFYARAICLRAIENGDPKVIVYRARYSENPRLESVAKIGSIINANILLADLRKNIGVDTALGVPAGPNSGLNIDLID